MLHTKGRAKKWKTIQGKVKNVEPICHYRLSMGGRECLQSLLQCFSFEMNIESYNHQMNYKKYQFHIFDMELLIITHFVANLKKKCHEYAFLVGSAGGIGCY